MAFVFKIMKCKSVTACFTEKSLIAAVAVSIQFDMQRSAVQTAFFYEYQIPLILFLSTYPNLSN